MLVLAHLLPLFFGVATYVTFFERPAEAGGWLRAGGYGYLIGITAVVLLIALLKPAPVDTFRSIALMLMVLGMGLLWFRRKDRHSWEEYRQQAAQPEPSWTRWLVLGLSVWLLVRGSSLVIEVASRNVFPWDAWSTWSVKAKTWFLANTWLPFTGRDMWLEHAGSRFIPADHYPDAISLIEVWFASAAGGWNEPAVLSLWPMCWLSGMAILAGQLRALLAPWWLCVAAVYAWSSLPLIQTHVALAGYVDLPMAVAFGAAVLAIARRAYDGGRRQLLLGLLIASSLPALKHEGALWLLVLVLSAIVGYLPDRRRMQTVMGVVCILFLVFATFGLYLWLPGLGWIEAGWGHLRIANLSVDLTLAWRSVYDEVIQSLLLSSNWHLLWWMGPCIAAASFRHWYRLPTLGATIGMALGCVFLIFFFTDASAWAENLTAVNRVLMHVTLAMVAWLAYMAGLSVGAIPVNVSRRSLDQDGAAPTVNGSCNASLHRSGF